MRLPRLCPVQSPPTYSVVVRSDAKWLNANQRGAWSRRYRAVRAWREASTHATLTTGVLPLRQVYVLAELRFPTNRRRDPGNWYPTVKACIDGLVDAGILRDDNAEQLVGPDLRLGEREAGTNGCVILHIWPVTPEEAS